MFASRAFHLYVKLKLTYELVRKANTNYAVTQIFNMYVA